MKKTKVAAAALGISLLALATGCEQQPILFEGEEMSVKKAESIIENRIEIENELDYDVTILEESE